MAQVWLNHGVAIESLTEELAKMDVGDIKAFMSCLSGALLDNVSDLPDCARKRILRDLASGISLINLDDLLWKGAR